MYTLIEISCVDQKLIFTKKPTVSSGGHCENKIKFTFCPKWDALTKTALFKREPDIIAHAAIDDAGFCTIPDIAVATEGKLYISAYGTSAADAESAETRTSDILVYDIVKGADSDAPDTLAAARAEQEEIDRDSLAESMNTQEENNGLPLIDYSGKTFSELLGIIESTGMLTDADRAAIDFWHCIEAQTAADTQYITVLSRLNLTVPTRIPRLDTAHITGYDTGDGTGTLAGGTAYLSPKIVSFDIDVSGLGANGLSYNENTFVGGYRAMSGNIGLLENATFRGCQNIKNLSKALYASENIKTVEFYNLETLTSIAWAFRGCTNLETITGSELDLTDIATNNLSNAFYGCTNLKEVRFKANTISGNISLSQSSLLTKTSVLSLINAVIKDSDITVSLNSVTKTLMNNSYAFYNNETQLWEDCVSDRAGAYSYTTILTSYINDIHTTLSEYFKGVTLA